MVSGCGCKSRDRSPWCAKPSRPYRGYARLSSNLNPAALISAIWWKPTSVRKWRSNWQRHWWGAAWRCPSSQPCGLISSAFFCNLPGDRARQPHEAISGAAGQGRKGPLYLSDRLCADRRVPVDHGLQLHPRSLYQSFDDAGSFVLPDLRPVPAHGAYHHHAAHRGGTEVTHDGGPAHLAGNRNADRIRKVRGKHEPHRTDADIV